MIVVDTNVIAYLWIPGTRTHDAEKLLSQDPEWIAPLLWRSEFCNILAGYLRQKHINLETAQQLIEAAESQMEGAEYSVSSPHVLKLAGQSKCSAYDCEFVALAQDLERPLVTADKQVLSAVPKLAFAIDKFVN